MAGKDRKRQLARQRYERQQERRAARQARARRIKIVASAVAVVVVAGGIGGVAFAMNRPEKKDKAAAQPSSPTAAPTVSVKPGECAYQPLAAQAAQAAKDVGKPPVKPDKGTYEMTINTNLGKIVAKLDGTKAACTVNSFKYLAGKNFFDNTSCHRLVTKGIKVLQCGDPSGTGQGGPKYGYANENVPKGTKAMPDGSKGATYKRGVVAMANTGQPNSNGSQFFIVYGDSDLPANYTVFGEVTTGLDIVDSVAKAGTSSGDDGPPKKKTEIKDLTVTKM